MKKVIIDTSTILFGLSNKVDIFELIGRDHPDYEIIISKGTINELKRLASTKKKNAADARTALLILPKKKVSVAGDKGYVDKWILKEAPVTGALVCTNDTALRRKLRSNGVTVVTLGIGGSLR